MGLATPTVRLARSANLRTVLESLRMSTAPGLVAPAYVAMVAVQ